MSEALHALAAFSAANPLGITGMDDTHGEFVELCMAICDADEGVFVPRLHALFEHTREHFRREELLMRESAFPATAEHTGEHQRVLGELHRFVRRAEAGRTALARAWIREAVPEWFRSHLLTMDSALAAHVRSAAGGRHVHLRV